ncbi:hypothetical protein [Paenibacillus lutimineralis]|uniref:Uncharacterized protein n=1 Tax=Paenibacillus lutimineralis TaxID=2707005 RepID=A0A3S9V2A8_9BACL|nr:hypothetical protein [Paenibacillus lutimineralis]AZS16630.1 hypothetical protein EI981_20655 [Paenibacillus lutimineralis]
MKQYSAQLEEQQIEILRNCIGKQIQFVNSPGAENRYNSTYIGSYYSFSISIDNDFFLIFKNVWLETDVYNDYWKLIVECGDKPDGIIYNIKQRSYSGPHFTYHLPQALRLEKIEIYQKTELIGEEQVHFDYAVLLHLEEDITLAFFPMESIADGIEMNTNKEHINQALNDCSLRKVIM